MGVGELHSEGDNDHVCLPSLIVLMVSVDVKQH